ncbi:uncharacterized protein PFL1_02409 [Pseudozyma flocculosa PF-1]|uniref:uncharacterized protein n=1 Tax=Pseudozyma flocculosa PF-1 TaxID=1277687 RepID=UPI0004560047|nr:uncharacterized protein PFL1_02409 [Pseudozyma flocculosa PF-1]EPQ30293.1 hypothetical protein PFL1_02409 [Pseudozyma flocculosa PF-1]
MKFDALVTILSVALLGTVARAQSHVSPILNPPDEPAVEPTPFEQPCNLPKLPTGATNVLYYQIPGTGFLRIYKDGHGIEVIGYARYDSSCTLWRIVERGVDVPLIGLQSGQETPCPGNDDLPKACDYFSSPRNPNKYTFGHFFLLEDKSYNHPHNLGRFHWTSPSSS